MKTILVTTLIVALVISPIEALAQRGGGGGGRGGGGGGWSGGGGRSFGGGGGWSGGGGGGGRGGWSGGGGGMQGHGAGQAAAGGGRNVASRQHAPNHFASQHAHFSGRPNYHGNWYHGDWHGHWAHPWGYRPWGWGWGGWGPGFAWGFGIGLATVGVVAFASPWSWGYYGYYNPYWVAPVGGVTYINYSQPVIVAAPTPVAVSDGSQQARQAEALGIFDNARNLFRNGQYQAALSETDRALALLPNDSVMHEFRALCLFAVKDYQQSAAAVHAVVTTGPGWDWPTVQNLYPDPNVYAMQLQALEHYRDENPEAVAARFLLGYHYLLQGRNEQAAAELQRVVELEPRDQLAEQLLKGLTTPIEAPSTTSGPSLEPATPVDASSVVGTWNASRSDGSKFQLNLTSDNKFNWKFTQQDKKQTMNGTYTLADNYLILKASEQNVLVGQVAMDADNRLKFKLAGGNPAEPGLTFTR